MEETDKFDDTEKTTAEGDNLGVESTTASPETEKTGNTAADKDQAEAENGNLLEAGDR